ncbi:hypothetical protein [Lapidilactobacillus bayanensis]|uniref:hypothetical protein n=1 Tax=Lapidilactobacillus bayanensis TaxID=2485998 RepID=UPI000F7A24F5|nr:hypothetical protein [Lapidilactobacillus bayanensis]
MTQLTKIVIMDALKDDLSQKQFTKYTVTELLRSTRISRSTLYYHFDGGLDDALVFTFRHELVQPLMSQQLNWKTGTAYILDYLFGHQVLAGNIYVLTVGPERLAAAREDFCRAFWAGCRYQYQRQQLRLLCAALLAELQIWTTSDFAESPEQIRQRLLTFEQNLTTTR